MAAITAEGITRRFGELTAVDEVSLEVSEGEVFGLLGPNGAGKTTFIRMLSCLISPSSGSAEVMGMSISDDAAEIRRIIGILPENPGVYPNMTAYQNLDFYAKLYGLSEDVRAKNIEHYLGLFGLWDRRHDEVGKFSKGMKQKVALARALVHDPKIIFLDEPTSGLDPKASKIVNDSLIKLKGERRTIFLNTHNLHEAQMLCDRVSILNKKIVAQGTPKELERSLWSNGVVVDMTDATKKVVAAVRKLSFVKNVESDEARLLIELDDPGKNNPKLIKEIVKAGGEILYVTEKSHSLEDVYLEIMGG